MSTAQIILAVILFGIAAALVIAGIRHLQCKGYCFNNAYIYASKDERETMYLRPYYKQSGIVFLMSSTHSLEISKGIKSGSGKYL